MGNQAQIFFVIRHAATCTAERIRRTNDNGIAELVCNRNALFYRVSNIRRNARLIDFFHRFLEELSIFRTVDCVQLRTDKLYAVFRKEARFCKLATHRKPRLSAKRSQQAVGFFFQNNTL